MSGLRSRVVIIGEDKANRSFSFPNNVLQTAVYSNFFSLITFGLMWIIFKSLASFYFLLVSIFQLLTPFSPTGRFSTFAPYASNKIIELYFLFYDNSKKKLNDLMINQRQVRVITPEGAIVKSRGDLKVGDVVQLEAEWRKEEVPADILLLYSPSRDVYVNMASLTGEKDPVQRHVPNRLELQSPAIAPVFGVLYTQPPNQDLESFDGLLCFGTERYVCTVDNTLLAGSILLQGSDVYGVVFATHSETKLHMKSSSHSHKVGMLDSTTNLITGWTLLFLVSSIMFGAIGHYLSTPMPTLIPVTPLINQTTTTTTFNVLLNATADTVKHQVDEDVLINFSTYILQIILMYFLLFNGLIAQTLHFTLDVVRRLQVYLYMKRSEVHNYSTLETLGLLDCIVFDKTGTLTTNRLLPKRFSCYQREEKGQQNSLVEFYADCVKMKHDKVPVSLHRLLLSICLNNSVARLQSDQKPDVVYFGTSSDEVVLMEAAHRMANYLLVARENLSSGQQIRLHTVKQDDNEWQMIQLFKYTSAKGKMTVIVRNQATRKLYLITKGSPERMIPILKEEQQDIAEESVAGLASEGLRVLLFAWRELDSSCVSPSSSFAFSENEDDLTKHLDSIRADSVLLDAFCFDLEKEMDFVGCTGTEDSLQPDLLHTIQTIQEAGIKTFMCTGDIKLTAKNIGINCGILPRESLRNAIHDNEHDAEFIADRNSDDDDDDPNMGIIFDIRQDYHHTLDEQLQQVLNCSRKKGVLIGKRELPVILNHFASKELFKQLVNDANLTGLVVYRADPAMKSLLSAYLKNEKFIICCVGDGANDIEMIKTANVGIGIIQGENQHAAASSDIAVETVSQLPAMICHLGKTNWIRNTNLTLFISSMKLTVVMTLLLYDCWTGFQVNSLFTGKMLLAFNVFYGWGVLAYGVFYFPVSEQNALQSPKLYQERPGKEIASMNNYFIWWFRACLDSFLALTICTLYFESSEELLIPLLGNRIDVIQFSTFVTVLIWINVKVSVVAGIQNWQVVKPIHAAVAATLFVFALCTVQTWPFLPNGFLAFTLTSTVGYMIYHSLLDRLFLALGLIKRVSLPTAKLHKD